MMNSKGITASGRTPLPGEASERAMHLGHDQLPLEDYDRTGVVMALKPQRLTVTSYSLDIDPTGPTIEQIAYRRKQAYCRFDRWGVWHWRVYVADEWTWVARDIAYKPALERPTFADAPLAVMPGT